LLDHAAVYLGQLKVRVNLGFDFDEIALARERAEE
jgi:hypothetical protein